MNTLLSAVGSLLSFRVRSRASLELELVALRHQLTVLRRQHPGQPRLFSADGLLWVWLYRIWPQVLDAMVLVKPATVLDWHRQSFRLYWRRRSRHLGRPRMSREIRDLIRQMSLPNALWGAPRIHGELLTRYRGQPGHGRQIPAVAAQGPLPDLALVSAQPPA
jgi:putative transposase